MPLSTAISPPIRRAALAAEPERHRVPKRRSYRRRSRRRRLSTRFALRYAACLVAVAVLPGAAILAGSPPLACLIAAAAYLCCGLYLSGFLYSRAIWIAIEPAQVIAEDRRAMLLLWPARALLFLHDLGSPTRAAR